MTHWSTFAVILKIPHTGVRLFAGLLVQLFAAVTLQTTSLLFLCFVVATSGSIKVSLTNGCWGNVAVCVGMRCGGLCEDTWSDQKSAMLCGNLGCGRQSKSSIKKSDDASEVIVKSVHITEATTNLNQSILVRNYDKETTCPKSRAYVVCSGNAPNFINAIILIQNMLLI